MGGVHKGTLWGLSPKVGVTLAVGLGGALLAKRFGFPGGVFTGAMLAAAVARLCEAPVEAPPKWLQVVARIVLGLTIGALVTPDTLRSIAEMAIPVTVTVLSMAVLGTLVAWVINRLTGMPLPTALCAATPGVLSAMVALADDLGADARVVASMHLVRMLSIVMLVSSMVRAIFAPVATAAAVPVAAATATSAAWPQLCGLLVLGLGAGFVARRLKVPAGDLLASLVVAAVANPAWLHLNSLPASWRFFAQWVVGAGVGATVTRAALRDFRPFALAGGLMTAFLIAAGLAFAWLLSQATSIDLVTCIIGSSPGGADAMVILGGELGANVQLVAVMHVARQVILLLVLPALTRVATSRRAAEA